MSPLRLECKVLGATIETLTEFKEMCKIKCCDNCSHIDTCNVLMATAASKHGPPRFWTKKLMKGIIDELHK